MTSSFASFDRLDPDLRRLIYEAGWQRLRPIQQAAIDQVFDTEDNLILAAPTAAGKTEAAYLPVLSRLDRRRGSVRVLALSPLIALINDQLQRVYDLCRALDIPVWAWHGEASSGEKRKLLQAPGGILLMTPESLEAMLDLHPERCDLLFSDLSWIFVDELHSFLGGGRGAQLRSLLTRLQERIRPASPRYMGLSATLAAENWAQVKTFFPSERACRILLDERKRDIVADGQLFEGAGEALPPALVEAIFRYVKKENLLLFPNARRRVEELAHAIKLRARQEGMSVAVFAHHSGVEKHLRQEAERFAKEARGRFCLCATSTLELGIDVGSVDSVCQIEAPPSASALAQRLGRSGRGEVWDAEAGRFQSEAAQLHFLASGDLSYLQGVAALDLVQKGRLDPIAPCPKPYDVLAHQLLAMILEQGSLSESAIKGLSDRFPVFSFLTDAQLDRLLRHFQDQDLIEWVEGAEREAILGLAGERIAGRRDFYALFQTEESFEVLHGRERLGRLPLQVDLRIGSRFLLAGRVWAVVEIQENQHRLLVQPAGQGKGPTFGGQAPERSALLCQHMGALLDQLTPALCELPDLAAVCERLRARYPGQGLFRFQKEVPSEERLLLLTGTAYERTLYLYLQAYAPSLAPAIHWRPGDGTIEGRGLFGAMSHLLAHYRRVGQLDAAPLVDLLADQPSLRQRLLAAVKYKDLLPSELQIDYILSNLCLPGQALFSGRAGRAWDEAGF